MWLKKREECVPDSRGLCFVELYPDVERGNCLRIERTCHAPGEASATSRMRLNLRQRHQKKLRNRIRDQTRCKLFARHLASSTMRSTVASSIRVRVTPRCDRDLLQAFARPHGASRWSLHQSPRRSLQKTTARLQLEASLSKKIQFRTARGSEVSERTASICRITMLLANRSTLQLTRAPAAQRSTLRS